MIFYEGTAQVIASITMLKNHNDNDNDGNRANHDKGDYRDNCDKRNNCDKRDILGHNFVFS